MRFIFLLLQDFQSNYDRPWQFVVPPLEQSVDIVEKYPSDEEENGMVSVAWRGPLSKVILISGYSEHYRWWSLLLVVST